MIEAIRATKNKNKITFRKSSVIAIEEDKWFDEEQKKLIKITKVILTGTSFFVIDSYEDLKKKIFRSKEYV